MKVETWPIERVIPYARNPRKNAAAVPGVAGSLKEFGWRQPLVVDGEGVIVVGHTRWLAAQQLGMAEVPVHVAVGLTPAQVKAYRIRDNKSNEIAEWDAELLAVELEDLKDEDYDLGLTGLSGAEIVELVGAAGLGDGGGLVDGADEDNVPEVPTDAVTVPGEIIIMGQHRLLCGDSTKAADVERLMDGKLADMVWTDPPYNVEIVGGSHALPPDKRRAAGEHTIMNDKMDDGAFRIFLRSAFEAAVAATREGGPIYVAHADSEGINFRSAMIEGGWLLKQCLIWVKNSLVLGRQDFHWKHEPILYGWKPGAAHSWYGDRDKTTVLEFDRPSRSDDHPTMKPVALVQYCIENSSQVGDRVLDVFGGSGTTMIACEKIGRAAYLVELDPRYCDVIARRWEEATGQKAKRVLPKGVKRAAKKQPAPVEVG